MCNFLSVLILRNGDVLHHPMLDSHSDLVTFFKLPDENDYIRRFAKAELTPTTDWTDSATWSWKIDEPTRPDWLDEVEKGAEDKTRAIAQRMVLKDAEHTLIVDGCWIIAGKSKVRDIRSGRIMRVQDSATVSGVGGSATVSGVWDSATVRDVWGSATVSGVWDSATVRDVWGSATVSGVGGSATVSGVWDSATVSGVRGSATVSDVWGSATVSDVWGSATVSGVRGSATVSDVRGSATVSDVGDSATVSDVGDSATLDASAQAHMKD